MSFDVWLIAQAIVMLMMLIGVWMLVRRVNPRPRLNRTITLIITHDQPNVSTPTLAPLVRQRNIAGAYSEDGLYVYTAHAINGVTCHNITDPELRDVIRSLARGTQKHVRDIPADGSAAPDMVEVWEMLGHPDMAARERELRRQADELRRQADVSPSEAPCPRHWIRTEDGGRLPTPVFGCAACAWDGPPDFDG